MILERQVNAQNQAAALDADRANIIVNKNVDEVR